MFFCAYSLAILLKLNIKIDIHNTLWFAILTAIILPLVMWAVSPDTIKNKVKNFFKKNKMDKNISEKLKKIHVGISNERQLLVDEFVTRYKYVFFPVVPNKTPNIIHVTFINTIKKLEKLGLKVYVFIYDDYFCRVKGYNLNERKTYITNFAKSLQKMGIKKKQIIFESDFIKKNRKAKKAIETIYSITSKLTINEANNLSVVNGHYLDDESNYIRKFKSILNMTYPNCISSKIGFVLSGRDEKKLWEVYANSIDENIVHLYIEALYTSNGSLSNILDVDILSCEDSLEKIKEKLSTILNDSNSYNENCSVFYLLKYNYFDEKKSITFQQKSGTYLEINAIDALIDYCKKQLLCGKIESITINTISQIVFKIFHPKEGE